jgi:hypothetical protein
MWYDKFTGIPPRGSPLETIFVMVRLERQQSQLLETRALIQSIVGLHESRKTQDPAIEAFQEYCSKMFPFLDRALNVEKDEAHRRLMEFTKHPAKIALHPIYKQQAEHAKKMATLKRFKLQPKAPGTI